MGSPQLEDEKVMKGLKLPVDLFHVRSPGQLSRVRPGTAKGTKAYFCERWGGWTGAGGAPSPGPPDQRRHLFMSELKEKVVLRGGEEGRGGDGNAAGSFSNRLHVSPRPPVCHGLAQCPLLFVWEENAWVSLFSVIS